MKKSNSGGSRKELRKEKLLFSDTVISYSEKRGVGWQLLESPRQAKVTPARGGPGKTQEGGGRGRLVGGG